MKNYYSILSVLPTAELVVIRAAYKALVQIYHPDKYTGDQAHGEALLKDFNEAWSVLSDAEKRRNYDALFASATNSLDRDCEREHRSDDLHQVLVQTFPELTTVVVYYPDIWNIITRLQKISHSLAGGFVATLLATKEFAGRTALADALTEQFFTSYFGTDEKILAFAKLAVELGERDAAMELNEAVRVFGAGIETTLIINAIDRKYGITSTINALKAESQRRAQLERELECERAQVEALRLAMDQVTSLHSRPYAVSELNAAIQPIRQALGIRCDFERVRTRLFTSVEEVAVFRHQGKEWRIPFELVPFTHWVFGTLMPLAKQHIGKASI